MPSVNSLRYHSAKIALKSAQAEYDRAIKFLREMKDPEHHDRILEAVQVFEVSIMASNTIDNPENGESS